MENKEKKKRTKEVNIKTHNDLKLLTTKIDKILSGIFQKPVINCAIFSC